MAAARRTSRLSTRQPFIKLADDSLEILDVVVFLFIKCLVLLVSCCWATTVLSIFLSFWKVVLLNQQSAAGAHHHDDDGESTKLECVGVTDSITGFSWLLLRLPPSWRPAATLSKTSGSLFSTALLLLVDDYITTAATAAEAGLTCWGLRWLSFNDPPSLLMEYVCQMEGGGGNGRPGGRYD